MADLPPVNVPNVRGVPQVNFATSNVFASTLMTADGPGVARSLGPNQWGIFLNNRPIIVASSTIEFEFKQECAISDYPVEQGGFESFDKVHIPFDGRIKFSAGGSAAAREALLISVSEIVDDLKFYTLVTPEITYPRCNMKHHDYRRTAQNGRGLLVVEIWMEEVREKVTATSVGSGKRPSQPSGADQENGGPVSATSVDDNTKNLLGNNSVLFNPGGPTPPPVKLNP